MTGHMYILFYFGCTVDELMVPEVVLVVLDQFNERNEQTPRMRPVDDQALQKNSEKRKERKRERERERERETCLIASSLGHSFVSVRKR